MRPRTLTIPLSSMITMPSTRVSFRALLLAVLLFMAAGGAVATGPDHVAPDLSSQPPAPVREADIRPVQSAQSQSLGLPQASALAEGAQDGDGPAPRIVRGNDRMIAVQASARGIQLDGDRASLRFEQAPALQVVHAVFGDMLGLDYIVHEPLDGTITLSTQEPIPPEQILLVLESVLQANGIVMVRDSGGLYHVGKPENLSGVVAPPRVATGRRLAPGSGVVIVPLRFIGAAEMADILRPVAPAEAFVRVDTLRNLLVLAGARPQVEGWLELVNTFDIDILEGMSVGVFPLRYASVREVQAALELMGPAGAAAGSGDPARPSGQAAGTAGGSTGLPGAVRILPIERLNSILVVTPRAAYLDQARRWIEQLDQPGGGDASTQLYVYRVQNGSASHLATVLNGLFGGGDGAEAAEQASSVAPGLRRAGASTAGRTAQPSGALSASGTAGGAGQLPGDAGQTQAGGLVQATYASGVRVIADELNNAILIYGPRAEYGKIEAALRRLDLAPTQVLIEASIIEVSLNDELSYGLQWYFQDSTRGGLSGAGTLNLAASGGLAARQPGFSYTLTGPLGDVRAVLNALADKSLVRVISSPSLMVLDNHTAAIQVGDQQPVQSGETITDGGVRSVSIEYKDTGVNLSVTPSVNAGDVVTMRILQAVTEVGPVDSATGQRSFQHRQIGSRVAVRSGDSVVLGGLIRDNSTRGKAGVPILHELPLVGALFGSTTVDTGRTELLIVVTPRVVRSAQEANELSQELRHRMQGLRDMSWPPARGERPE